MSSNTQTQDSNIVADIVGNLFEFTGKTIGATAGATYDVVAGTVEGVMELPKAVVEGFEKGFTFESEPVKKEEVKTISKEEYREQLLKELARLDESEKTVQISEEK